MSRCRKTTLYLSPDLKVPLSTHTVTALIGADSVRITHRAQILKLEETYGWDGTCEVVFPDGTTRRYSIDSRIAYGHLPRRAANWRIRQISGGASLLEVGGPRQLAETLFGLSSPALGRAAHQACGRGDAPLVAALSGAMLAEMPPGEAGRGGGQRERLLDAQQITRRLLESRDGRRHRLYAAADPQDWQALGTLVAAAPAKHRRSMLLDMLDTLPPGLGKSAAAEWAKDRELREWIVEQGSWDAVQGCLEAVEKLDGQIDPEDAAAWEKTLRARGIIAACVVDDHAALEILKHLPGLHAIAGQACLADLAAALSEEGPDLTDKVRKMVAHFPDVSEPVLAALIGVAPPGSVTLSYRLDGEERSVSVGTYPDSAFSYSFEGAQDQKVGELERRRTYESETVLCELSGSAPERARRLVEAGLASGDTLVALACAGSLSNLADSSPRGSVEVWLAAAEGRYGDAVRMKVLAGYTLEKAAQHMDESQAERAARALREALQMNITRESLTGGLEAGKAQATLEIVGISLRDGERASPLEVTSLAHHVHAGSLILAEHTEKHAAELMQISGSAAMRLGSGIGGEWFQRVATLPVLLRHRPAEARAVASRILSDEEGRRELAETFYRLHRGGAEQAAPGAEEIAAQLLEKTLDALPEALGEEKTTARRTVDMITEEIGVFARLAPEETGRLLQSVTEAVRTGEAGAGGRPVEGGAKLMERLVRPDSGGEDLHDIHPELAAEIYQVALEQAKKEREARRDLPEHEQSLLPYYLAQIMGKCVASSPGGAEAALEAALLSGEVELECEAAMIIASRPESMDEATLERTLQKAADTATDPDAQAALAAAGAKVRDPRPAMLIDGARAARTEEEAAQQLASASSARQLLHLAVRYEPDPKVQEALDGKRILIEGRTHITNLIRSLAELERNAAQMRNCTLGYSSRLRNGDMMLVLLDETGAARFNAHVRSEKDGWSIAEVNGIGNKIHPDSAKGLKATLGGLLRDALTR